VVESKRVVLFLDVIDALLGQIQQGDIGETDEATAGSRRPSHILAELLIPLTDIARRAEENRNLTDPYLLIVAAANRRAEYCDPSIEHCFGAHLHLELPFENDRNELLTQYLRDFDTTIAESELISLVDWTDGRSCSDLRNLTREAATINAKRKFQAYGKVPPNALATPAVSIADLEDAIVSRSW
jgi:SpoVK/Ycf46/Vps4 family AAA+-type ATPase